MEEYLGEIEHMTENDDFTKMIHDLQRKIEYEEEGTFSQIVINEFRNC